jgi:hypothetical protein
MAAEFQLCATLEDVFSRMRLRLNGISQYAINQINHQLLLDARN